MGFLHKLWDETLAGPAPDSGLGKLRKYDSFSAPRSSSSSSSFGTDVVPITRSITVLKNNPNFRNLTVDTGSAPDSPVGSSGPGTPYTPGTPDGSGKIKKFTRRRPSNGGSDRIDPGGGPTGYDWIVISALDR